MKSKKEAEYEETESKLTNFLSQLKGFRRKFKLRIKNCLDGNKIDLIARIAFPTAFILFNVGFCTYVAFIVPNE